VANVHRVEMREIGTFQSFERRMRRINRSLY